MQIFSQFLDVIVFKEDWITCIICWCRSKTGVRSLSPSVQSFLTVQWWWSGSCLRVRMNVFFLQFWWFVLFQSALYLNSSHIDGQQQLLLQDYPWCLSSLALSQETDQKQDRNVSYSSLPALKYSKAVRNLGIVLDGELSFNNRINKVTRTAFSDFKIYLTLENSYLNVINCCMCSYVFYLNLNASRNTTCWECFQELWSCYLWSCVCLQVQYVKHIEFMHDEM